jgi:ABC-type Mn2+/Zn2+ transport system ATPase subunit
MTNTNETAEPSGASAGSQPVAWMVEWTDHIDLFRSRSCAEYVASGDVKVQPLYRSPALTDEEREAIERAMNTVKMFHGYDRKITKSLRGLLQRNGAVDGREAVQ